MRAALEIRLRADRSGRVDASGTLAAAPLWCRWDGTTLWIVGSAASPVADDDVTLRVEVGPGVHAAVRSVAAMVLYTARGEGSTLRTEIVVDEGASLHWAPEPVIITAGARHRSITSVEVARRARVAVDELVVDGRNAEDRGGRLTSELALDIDGGPVLRSSYDTSTPGWDGPGGTDGARCLATRLAVGHDPDEDASPGTVTTATLLQPEGGGRLAVSLAEEPTDARSQLDEVLPLRRNGGERQPLVETPPSSGMTAPVR